MRADFKDSGVFGGWDRTNLFRAVASPRIGLQFIFVWHSKPDK
jgi:hypothetical protein